MTQNSLIAYQGEPGANSDIACRDVFPDWTPLPCASFEDALGAIQDGTAELTALPPLAHTLHRRFWGLGRRTLPDDYASPHGLVFLPNRQIQSYVVVVT